MKFTEIDKSVMIGLLLGDGYIDDKGRVQIEHCAELKEYCIYKAKLLHSVCGGKDVKVHEIERTRSERKDGKEWKSNKFTTVRFRKLSKSFLLFRDLLYSNGKKEITLEVLNLLSPLSIALWWLDDGCLTKKKLRDGTPGPYMLRICTYLPKEQNELIANYFKNKYNMKWNVVKADGAKDDSLYMLRCGLTEGRKFLNIIRDIVLKNVPTMLYKVIDI